MLSLDTSKPLPDFIDLPGESYTNATLQSYIMEQSVHMIHVNLLTIYALEKQRTIARVDFYYKIEPQEIVPGDQNYFRFCGDELEGQVWQQMDQKYEVSVEFKQYRYPEEGRIKL